MRTYHGKLTPLGASRMELSLHPVAIVNESAVVGAHAKNELDSRTVESEPQPCGRPSDLGKHD